MFTTNILNAQQSKNFTVFSLKAFFKLLESIKCFFSSVKRQKFQNDPECGQFGSNQLPTIRN